MKRWWLPSQKGADLWPRTTINPPKLVIEGVRTGTPLYHAVAQRFAGRLKQFHGKAQQNYSLSPNASSKQRMEWGDGRAEYTNTQGQEIIRLEVDERVTGELKAAVEKPVPDFAVVDLVVADSADLVVKFSTALKTPAVDDGVEKDLDTSNSAISQPDYSAGVVRPIIEYADPFDITETIASSNRISSLKVDFRDLAREAMVVIDIYGQLSPDNISNPDTITGYVRSQNYISWTGWSVHREINYTEYWNGPNPTTLVSDDIEAEYTPFHNFYYAEAASLWFYSGGFIDINGNQQYTDLDQFDYDYNAAGPLGGALPHTTGPTVASDRPGWNNMTPKRSYIITGHLVYAKIPVYGDQSQAVHVTRDCDLTYAFYDPGQIFVPARLQGHLSGDTAAMWLVEAGQFPERLQFAELTMNSEDSGQAVTEDNPLGFDLLCTIVLDRQTRSVGFTPASS